MLGAGNVGRRFLELMVSKERLIRTKLGLELVLVGAADSSGWIADAAGLDSVALIETKLAGSSLSKVQGVPLRGRELLELVHRVDADLLLDATPGNMVDGQPGLGCMEAAMDRGLHVVTANKAPLVLDYGRLVNLAASKGVSLLFDATVTGGLPAINIGRRDLAHTEILGIEGILNLTTNYILTRMAEDGLSYEEALADAQRAGHAEADPTMDVEGWDAANKLVILANSVLGQSASLNDVSVEGILGITTEMLREASARGETVKLLAVAEQDGGRFVYSVRPVSLDASHPMATLRPKQMGIVYHTDICGSVAAAIVEETPVPTAAAMLRDVVQIYVT
jgi:homoserine dehydrogenase